MPKYCDPDVLEHNWCLWLLAKKAPQLEELRKHGLLWSKLQRTKGKLDPHREIVYCAAFARPVFFNANLEVPKPYVTTKHIHDVTTIIGNLSTILTLHSNHDIHDLDNQMAQFFVVENLKRDGFVKEIPERDAWHILVAQIELICTGIASRMYQDCHDDREDLAYEALLQVLSKLVRGKLVYSPGRASVFNLLTTTIYRCMYTILSKRKNRRNELSRLQHAAERKRLPYHRSYQLLLSNAET